MTAFKGTILFTLVWEACVGRGVSPSSIEDIDILLAELGAGGRLGVLRPLEGGDVRCEVGARNIGA